VCSKNEHEIAAEPFRSRPEMVLRIEDFAAFKANWLPKSENLKAIAQELSLGLDSLVFIDDNPAEVEIVRQFVPEVETVLLSDDPSEYLGILQDCRLFEPVVLTAEDAERGRQYRDEKRREQAASSYTDMASYLASLEMEGEAAPLSEIDCPRVAQLINKSNQFNLTTKRRTLAETIALLGDTRYEAFTIRLRDKFGDHGLIAVVIGFIEGPVLIVDTWLMSCRVLKREVEEFTLNHIVELAQERHCSMIRGEFISTAKNGIVRDLYPSLGFRRVAESGDRLEYEIDVAGYKVRETKIQMNRVMA
jgi:FkbH-like protein